MSGVDQMLGENIRILAQVVTEVCQRSIRIQVSDPPLTRNQLYILRILATSGTYQIGDMARILSISTAAGSKNIDRLEQLGYVERQAIPGDRRGLEVRLQPAGQALLDRYEQISAQRHAPIMAQFNDEEKRTLINLLQRVVRYTLADEQDIDLICLQCGGSCGHECAVSNNQGHCHRPNGRSSS